MRDGIFIKDILNRGPAFESGKIAPGTSMSTQAQDNFQNYYNQDQLRLTTDQQLIYL